ncbi:MAG: hypothetical protein FWD34_07925 [Oscillospiraceae bacterium]|nr:hypothetical protein [Oscillospiraceae bacterium]
MASMRITGSTVIRRYVNNLERNFYKKNQSENRITSERRYTRASQSPLEAVKALKVRKAMSEVETYQRNLETAAGIYDTAQHAVVQISGILQNVQEKLIAAAHGTYAVHPDKQILATEIEESASEMVRLMNLIVADRRIFGGVNNEEQAYKIEDGIVFYNNVPVNRHQDPTAFPFSTTSFLDAGLGMAFLDPYTIDPQTAIPVTFNGAEILGSGLGGNLYTLDFSAFGNSVSTFGFDSSLDVFTFDAEVNGLAGTIIIDNTSGTPVVGGSLAPFVTVTEDAGRLIISSTDNANTLSVTNSAGAPGFAATTDTVSDVERVYSFVVTLGNNRQEINIQVEPGDTEEIIRNKINTELFAAGYGDTVRLTESGMFVSRASPLTEFTIADNPNLQQSLITEQPSGYPLNIIQLTLDAAKSARAGTDDQTALYADLLFASQSFLSLSIAKIGSEQKFIEFNQERLDNNLLSLKEQQNLLEFVDLGEEATRWKMLEMIYNATLQMSVTTVPQSIFNFMR